MTAVSLTQVRVSGLKSQTTRHIIIFVSSHPSTGEWIEIMCAVALIFSKMSHPSTGEWIEIRMEYLATTGLTSHPSTGEWIEILHLR